MPEKKKVFGNTDAGFFANMSDSVKLVLRLMADNRVPFVLKVLPIGTVLYLIFPDLIPFIIDDAIIMGVGTYFFIEMCPQDVVDEHRQAIRSARFGDIDENVIDGIFEEN